MLDCQCGLIIMIGKTVYPAYALVFLRRQTALNSSEHPRVSIAAQLYLPVLLLDCTQSLVNLLPVVVRSIASDPGYRPDTVPACRC